MSVRIHSLLFVATVLFLLALVPGGAVAQSHTTSGTAALSSEGTVVVDNHEGQITIETWDRAEVKYEAVVQPEEGAEHPEATVVRVEEGADRFEIRTEYEDSNADGDDSGWFSSSSQNLMPVAYTLTVPRAARVEIDDHESEIQIQGLEGPVGVDTHEGAIILTYHSGPADIDSHEGPITVEKFTGRLAIDAHDSTIRLRAIDGPIDIDAHEGQIDAGQLGGRLSVDMHDGVAQFAFPALTDDIDIETHDGSITLTVPSEAGFDLRTDFGNGVDLRSDFDLSSVRVTDDDETNYAGRVNGGGPRLSFTAHDGSFEIRSQ